ncbi:MAG: type II secretion system secretin GspD [Gammaproteobacteria bacterium]|nr:type II secretion system secretin GspD [Gammaproteobacteria bacterium]
MRQLLLTGSLALCMALPLHAEQNDGQVSLNFVNADIQEVIRAISQISGKNFLVDPRVKGTLNIVSATPVSADLAYNILLSALRMQGYASVESSGITKIIPEADAKLHVDTLASPQGKGDKLVTRVFILKNESASQLVNVVRPMVAPNNIVVAYPASNALVVTDYASGISRIEKLIASIDKAGNDLPLVIPVRHASAIDLANLINKLMPEATNTQPGDDNQRFVLTADSRTNALLLRSDNPGRIERVKRLVASLDSASSVPGNIHVITLKNAEAPKLAQTLNAILSGTATAAPVPTGQAAFKPATNDATSSGAVVQADAATNTLIVTASEPVYNNIRAVIEKLDVRRPQVFVEALIVEVTADKAAEFGIQWQSINGINKPGSNIIGGTNFGTTNNIIGAAADVTTVGQGLNVGIVKGTTTLLDGTKVLNLGMLARALESDTNANILSAPNLMTLDNEEAKIVVGQNVPFITGSYTNTGSSSTAANPFQTIERKDVGLTLKIKPQIMQGGTVKLQVYQEVSSVLSSSLTAANGITTNKRSIESSILVDENQIVVLGGLIQDSINNVQSKTPILGDIPLLGNLFRYETRQRSKTNLMVFIRPYIMYQADAAQQFSSKRYEQIGKTREDARLGDHLMLPDDDTGKMPSLKVDGAIDTSSASPAIAGTEPNLP